MERTNKVEAQGYKEAERLAPTCSGLPSSDGITRPPHKADFIEKTADLCPFLRCPSRSSPPSSPHHRSLLRPLYLHVPFSSSWHALRLPVGVSRPIPDLTFL